MCGTLTYKYECIKRERLVSSRDQPSNGQALGGIHLPYGVIKKRLSQHSAFEGPKVGNGVKVSAFDDKLYDLSYFRNVDLPRHVVHEAVKRVGLVRRRPRHHCMLQRTRNLIWAHGIHIHCAKGSVAGTNGCVPLDGEGTPWLP